MLIFYNSIKTAVIFLEHYKDYLGIALNAINLGLKYFTFILFTALIYIFNKNQTQYLTMEKTEETVGIAYSLSDLQLF